MSTAPETIRRGGSLATARRLLADNPTIVLTFVFVGLFVLTDIVNRAQSGEAFRVVTRAVRPVPDAPTAFEDGL